MTVRIALIGAGRIGQIHAASLAASRNADLVAIVDASEAAAVSLAGRHGCAVRRLDGVLAADDIDAVVICSPTGTHAALIERCARAGKAVFCEKPIDLSLDRVRACLKLAGETNARLMVGFNRRFDPDFQALHKAITEGRIGDVEMIQIISRDPGAPDTAYIRASGGIFRDMTIHDFDMARFLLPQEPMRVLASASVLTDPAIRALDDFDSASIILTTASGHHCTISNSRRATYGYDQRIEVHGSQGMIIADNPRPSAIAEANSAGFSRPPLQGFFITRYARSYAAEIEAFIAGVSGGQPLTPDGQDGLKALILAEAALLSVRENRAVDIAEFDL